MPSLRYARLALLAALFGAGPAAAQSGWTEVAPMPTPRAGAAVAVLDGQIYVIGGRGVAGPTVGVVERYDPATNAWTTVASLRRARANAAAAVLNGRIVLAGGRESDGEVSDDVEVYEPGENDWESFAGLREEREGLAVFESNGELYAFGGSSANEQFRADCEVYDPGDGNWRDYGTWTLGTARASFAAVPLGGAVVVAGGFGASGPLASAERYEVGAGGSPRAPLPEARGSVAAAAFEGRAWVIGGRNVAGAAVARVDAYNAATNTWTAGPALPSPREGAVAAAVGPTLYVFGGRDATGRPMGTAFAYSPNAVVGEEPAGPSRALALGLPTPNPSTGPIRLSLDASGTAPVVVEVLDALGRRVALLHDGPPAGPHHALTFDGAGLPPGVYVVRARQGGAQAVRRVTRLR